MEALIPKLFILTAEASIVLLLILIIMIIFNIKAKRKDLNAVNELVSHYIGSKEQRISALKKNLKIIGFKGSIDEQAEKLFQDEKTVIKEFVTLYLHRDTYRLLDYPDNLIENNDIFLKTSGSVQAATVTQGAEASSAETIDSEDSTSEETANATILAREQVESNEAHLKELSELRLKNTELNEHLFEALETITALMTEHGKKTGQEVESNAQKLLEAIIYLRDKRLSNENDPSKPAPAVNDNHDQVDSFALNTAGDSLSVDLANNDGTLDGSTAVNLGISDELNMDLDALVEDETIAAQTENKNPDESTSINLNNSSDDTDTTEPAAEDDPWADALAEQATAEAEAKGQDEAAEVAAEDDPWADALAEQAAAETEAETSDQDEAAEAVAEDDPWADALAEQAAVEAEGSSQAEGSSPAKGSSEEVDPWAEALAEQEQSEKK